MRRSLLAVSLLGFAAGCGDPEVIVTREQFGDEWPLGVNSAVVVCAEGGEAAVLKVGVRRYALNEAARALGHPDASEVAEPSADVSVLSGVCTPQVASNR
jgi:hypothetical protein